MIRINYGYLRMLYDAHLCNKRTVQQAVIDERITPEQYERITGEAYTAPEESAPEEPTPEVSAPEEPTPEVSAPEEPAEEETDG